MDENRFYVIDVSMPADGYQEPTEPKKARLEIESVSLQPTQKLTSFVTFCIENHSSHVCDEHRRKLVPYTTSGQIL